MIVAGAGGAPSEPGQVDLFQRWRDLGSGTLWLMVGAALGAWLVMRVVVLLAARPRRVKADAAPGGEPPGAEPPAVAATLAGRWRLRTDAVPATLLDLAARGHLAVEHGPVGPTIRVLDRPPAGDGAPADGGEALSGADELVLDRLRQRARLARDGRVPAAALAQGTRGQARRWWRRFRSRVYDDAVRRGLARRSRPWWLKLAVISGSVVAAAGVGVAVAGAVYGDDAASDQDLIEGAAFYGLFVLAVLLVAGFFPASLQDTAAGRATAARWLGYRERLAADPRVTGAGHDPVTAAAQGRELAYAAALGLAEAAVGALPMGAESRRRVWSPVGGSWREVRVRQPRFASSGHGWHPATAIVAGLVTGGLAGAWLRTGALMEDVDGLPGWDVVLVFGLPGLILAVAALSYLVRGLLDVVVPRTRQGGRVLRWHRRSRVELGDLWYVLVDDGTSRRLWPWRLTSEPSFGMNALVRADVSRFLHHVRAVEVVEEGDVADAVVERDAPASARALVEAGVDSAVVLARHADRRGPAGPVVPPGPLPGADVVGSLVGRPVEVRELAGPDVLLREGGLAVFQAGEGTVQLAWLGRRGFEAMRPRFLRREVEGIGERAYRRSGLLAVRQGDRAVMVVVRLPGTSAEDVHGIQEALARRCLDLSG